MFYISYKPSHRARSAGSERHGNAVHVATRAVTWSMGL